MTECALCHNTDLWHKLYFAREESGHGFHLMVQWWQYWCGWGAFRTSWKPPQAIGCPARDSQSTSVRLPLSVWHLPCWMCPEERAQACWQPSTLPDALGIQRRDSGPCFPLTSAFGCLGPRDPQHALQHAGLRFRTVPVQSWGNALPAPCI